MAQGWGRRGDSSSRPGPACEPVVVHAQSGLRSDTAGLRPMALQAKEAHGFAQPLAGIALTILRLTSFAGV